ncbi:MAG TPA: hypothetical protein VKH19_10680 [Gemmatimonadaceae bacterium]|nr:hypothetical protein [Gemmatimonadaceae bacterium]
MRPISRLIAASAVTAISAAALRAQQPSSPPAAPANMPNVGDMAPDFSARGATRFGLLRDPVRLSDYRGQTVVVWLFFKARTRG